MKRKCLNVKADSDNPTQWNHSATFYILFVSQCGDNWGFVLLYYRGRCIDVSDELPSNSCHDNFWFFETTLHKKHFHTLLPGSRCLCCTPLTLLNLSVFSLTLSHIVWLVSWVGFDSRNIKRKCLLGDIILWKRTKALKKLFKLDFFCFHPPVHFSFHHSLVFTLHSALPAELLVELHLVNTCVLLWHCRDK